MHQRRVPDRVKDAVKSRSKDGSISCKQALSIADRMDVNPKLVGMAADMQGIKVRNCQLGCFE